MERVISVVYKDGVFKPLEPVVLEEGTPAQVTYDEPSKLKERKLGMYSGAFQIADDFDDPLPDEFWLGKDVENEE